jgi:hypothetical protein
VAARDLKSKNPACAAVKRLRSRTRSTESFSGPQSRRSARTGKRQFFEFAGPLFSVTASPASTMVRVGEAKELRALTRDRSRRRVEHDLTFHWQIVEGPSALAVFFGCRARLVAPALSRMRLCTPSVRTPAFGR